jgi:hypothetical protein
MSIRIFALGTLTTGSFAATSSQVGSSEPFTLTVPWIQPSQVSQLHCAYPHLERALVLQGCAALITYIILNLARCSS